MASAREKFNSNGGGVPSLFAYTIKDTQKLGERRFPSKNKYVKNDITISKGIESRDSDLEGFGDVIKKVKKEDVQVPAGAIRKHKMVKQISGRFNSEGKKKGFDIFALIDDAIDKEPTEEAKEKARERAAAKIAVNDPIPPRVVRKKPKSVQPTPPPLQTQSTEEDLPTKGLDEPVSDRHVVDVKGTTIHNATSIPAMFTTSTTDSTTKREPAWKLRLQDKTLNTPTSTPVFAKQNSSSEDQRDKPKTPRMVVKDVGTRTIQSQVIIPEYASSSVAVIGETDSPDLGCKDASITFSTELHETGVTGNKDIGAPDEVKSHVIDPLDPVAVDISEQSEEVGWKDSPLPAPVINDGDISQGAKVDIQDAPIAVVATREIKTTSTQKEPAWKLRLQERQAASSTQVEGSNGTNLDLPQNPRTLASKVENPPLKKEPAWKLRLQERQADSAISEPVDPMCHPNVSVESVVVSEGRKEYTPSKQPNPSGGGPEDDDFSVSISSVESDQSHKEEFVDVAVSHEESVEQVVVVGLQIEPERSSVEDMKCNLENSAPLSEKSGVRKEVDEPEIHCVQQMECAVNDSTASPSERNKGEQSIGKTPLTAEPMSLPTTLANYSDDSDSDMSDSSSDDGLPVPMASIGAAMRRSEDASEVTRLVQTPNFASGFPLTEKVDALLARSNPIARHSIKAAVIGSPPDKLEFLREQIKETEKKIQATMVDAKLQVAELRKLFDNEKETMQDDFEERVREQRKLNLEQDKRHEKLLNEEKKIVESLRAENKMLRANVDRLPKQMAETKQSIANLEAANDEIATHTEDLLRFSKKLETDHDKLIESSKQCRDIYLPRYRKELRERQMALDTEIRIKTLYRDCAIKIAKHIGESSRKPDLIEEINALVLETEAEVNPKFDPRVLVGSDSDSSSSSDSDDSSDSDSSSD